MCWDANLSLRCAFVKGRGHRGYENPERSNDKSRQARPHARKYDPRVRPPLQLTLHSHTHRHFSIPFTISISQLHAMPQVLFAGYKVPHPLQPYFLVKIQTDGTITPTAALEQACTKLIGTLSSLEAKFKREFSFKDVEGVTTEDAYGTSNAGPAWASRRDYMDFER